MGHKVKYKHILLLFANFYEIYLMKDLQNEKNSHISAFGIVTQAIHL